MPNLLLDANVVLDLALKRARHPEVQELFAIATGDQLSISRFSLHAVAWFMTPENPEGFCLLMQDFINTGVSIVDLTMEELILVTHGMQSYSLDFDDAFNLTVADKLDLIIVSSDKDYDRTPRGRLTPGQAVSLLRNSSTP